MGPANKNWRKSMGKFNYTTKCKTEHHELKSMFRERTTTLKKPFVVFWRENICGWSLRTVQPIKKGGVIFQYVGKVFFREDGNKLAAAYYLTLVKGNKRLEALRWRQHGHGDANSSGSGGGSSSSSSSGGGSSSGSSIDGGSSGSSSIGGGSSGSGDAVYSELVIDGREVGNLSRYLNHACEGRANVVWQLDPPSNTKAGKTGGQMELPNMNFVAERDIAAGEELTFDYGYEPTTISPMWCFRCRCTDCGSGGGGSGSVAKDTAKTKRAKAKKCKKKMKAKKACTAQEGASCHRRLYSIPKRLEGKPAYGNVGEKGHCPSQ
jgi:hypothetical protein